MKMKIIWMPYIIIGTSIILLLNSCTLGETEYIVKANYIYINDTNRTIQLISSETINPKETFKITIKGDGGKNVTATSYVPPYPFREGSIIKYDNIKCEFLDSGLKAGKGEGPAGIQNYEWKKISERYYEFTYHFTEAEYNQAENCN